MFDCPVCGHKKSIPQTNADRIRAMSDEELKEFICESTDCVVCTWSSGCGCNLFKWLKQPVRDGDNDGR